MHPTIPSNSSAQSAEMTIKGLILQLQALSEEEQEFVLDRFREQLRTLTASDLEAWHLALIQALAPYTEASAAPGVEPLPEPSLYQRLLSSVVYVQDWVLEHGEHSPLPSQQVFEFEKQMAVTSPLVEADTEDWTSFDHDITP